MPLAISVENFRIASGPSNPLHQFDKETLILVY